MSTSRPTASISRLTMLDVVLEPGSTIAICHGQHADGRVIRFAGDWHPCANIAEPFKADYTNVQAWQILGEEEGP
jgi:hypothetical protein